MDRKEPIQLIRKNLPFYLTGLILVFFMKFFYSRAGTGQLLWLLAPTAGWVSLLSGIPFEYIQDMGYANHGMKILIAPSCSGMQFMIITAAMLLFSFVHLSGNLFTGRPANAKAPGDGCLLAVPSPTGRKAPRPGRSRFLAASYPTGRKDPSLGRSRFLTVSFPTGRKAPRPGRSRFLTASYPTGRKAPRPGRYRFLTVSYPTGKLPSPQQAPARAEKLKGFAWIGISLVLSFFFTVFVNGLRIITAIYLPLLFGRLQLFGDSLTPDSLHTAIGAVVYFGALLALYRSVGLLFNPEGQTSLLRRCMPPVFWYFSITLGVPFLNRAYGRNGEQFLGFAALITACCGWILLSYCAGMLLRKLLGSRPRGGLSRRRHGSR